MARIKTIIDVSSNEIRNSIRGWTSSVETREFAFLTMICQSFQNKMKEYYKAGSTDEDRFQRLCEIRQALTEIGFEDGERIFTIAPISSVTRDALRDAIRAAPIGSIPEIRSASGSCGNGEKDVGGVCMDTRPTRLTT